MTFFNTHHDKRSLSCGHCKITSRLGLTSDMEFCIKHNFGREDPGMPGRRW